MLPFKGIIFDFNGTLLLDSYLHEEAWIIIAAQLRTKPLTVKEFQLNGHGRTNKAIIIYLLERNPTNDELNSIVEEKESLYRKMSLENKANFKLAPGAIALLDSIKELCLPITIATGSYATNVDFYFEHLQLDKWFDRSLVVLDDGTYPGKPAPDIFRLAAQKLNLNTSECIVFEDSYSGISAAYNAGIGKVIAVEPELNIDKFSIPTKDIEFRNGFTKLDIPFLSGLQLVINN